MVSLPFTLTATGAGPRIKSCNTGSLLLIPTPDPLTVSSGTSLIDAAFEMSEVKIGSLIVNDEHGRVMGIFTSTDGLNALVEVLRGEILEEE